MSIRLLPVVVVDRAEQAVSGESAQFGIAEVQRGLFPLGGSTVRLQRQIAFTNAADLLLTGRLISAQLYGVTSWDPWSLSAAVIALGVFAFLATSIPAARASAIDPMRALRTE